MDTTVVNVESTTPSTTSQALRSGEDQKNLEMAIDSLKRLLRNENRQREVHKQLENCFKAINKYLEINTLEQAKDINSKGINFEIIKEAIKLIDIQLALVITNADMHDQIIEIVSVLSNDVKEVMTKVPTI
jgi:hypothetical protein